MRRREFIGGVTASIIGSPAFPQQGAISLVGYLSSRSLSNSAHIVSAFRQGLKDAGFNEGENVRIEYRFADGIFEKLSSLTLELVHMSPDILVATGGTVTVVKAKPVVPKNIPIVFAMGGDPVKLGIVDSLSRPAGNVTGVQFLVNDLAAKGIELLHELVPTASLMGFLVNPQDPNAAPDIAEATEAAGARGLQLRVGRASTPGEIDSAFSLFSQQKVSAVLVDTEPFFTDQRASIVSLAEQHSLPAVYQLREFTEVGGLVSYGTSITAANHQLGIYTGQILKGGKPANLPVVQSSRFELVVNSSAARRIGITIPASILGRADEVIE